jgi:hypothetical protein
MQSNVGMLTNLCGFIPAYHYLKDRRSRITLQAHDALHVSAHPDEVYDLIQFLTPHMTPTLTYWGTQLQIPVNWKIGASMGQGIEFKQTPTQQAVRDAIQLVLT